MKNTWVKRNKWIFFVAPLALVAFVAIFGEVVMHLWNWLLPPLFGWHQVTFWQALGLLVLCRILFGGFGGHGNGHRNKVQRRMYEHWEQLTPEERERLRQSWRGRCGGFETPPSESKEPA
ncbi:MAG: hypothetical protein ABSD67_05485 [Terracidiphilus sp.]|jgi:hypothetical protein